jgi:3-hydroxypropanoate dehydrogenase
MKLADAALDQLFRDAHTHNQFAGPVTDDDLRSIYDLMKWGPTTANSQPARFIFVRSPAAKERLRPALSRAISTRRWRPSSSSSRTTWSSTTRAEAFSAHRRPQLVRRQGRRHILANAFRGTLQGAYFWWRPALMLRLRTDVGFDNAARRRVLSRRQVEVNFLINLGHGVAKVGRAIRG